MLAERGKGVAICIIGGGGEKKLWRSLSVIYAVQQDSQQTFHFWLESNLRLWLDMWSNLRFQAVGTSRLDITTPYTILCMISPLALYDFLFRNNIYGE